MLSTRYRKTIQFALPLLLFILNSCELLLGADPTSRDSERIRWDSTVITTGTISGLDAGVSGGGDVVVSYLHEGSILRASSLEGGEWIHRAGPSVTGPLSTEYTHIAAGPSGEVSVLYYSDSDLHVANLGAALDTRYSLKTMEAEVLRGTRPNTWYHDSADLAYDSEGRLRIFARDVEGERLWLFRETAEGWVLDPLANSASVTGRIDMVVAGNGDEHVIFSTGSAGWYYKWSGSDYRWQERLQIADSPPFLLRFRQDESSVLAWRNLNRIMVAEEFFDELDGRYKWLARPVIEDFDLYWHNIDMALDQKGYPNMVYILGPLRAVYFEVWFARLLDDGSWDRSKIVENLHIDSFNPFDVRIVREPTGRIHIILRSGKVTGSSGGASEYEHRLLDIYSDLITENR